MGKLYYRWRLKLLVFLTVVVHLCHGAKILLVPVQRRSNIRELAFMAEDIVLNGHAVYMVLGVTLTNRDDITNRGIGVLTFHVPQYTELLYSPVVESEISDNIFRRKPEEDILDSISEIATMACDLMLRDRALIEVLMKARFDIAIVDGFPIAPCSAVLPNHLQIPFITVNADPVAIHQPVLPSFIPSPYLNMRPSMNFLDRFLNLVTFLIGPESSYPGVKNITLLHSFCPCVKSWSDLLRRAFLHISTADHLLLNPAPRLPNHVMLPGVTWRPSQPLQESVFKLMELTQDGAVVVNLGTAISAVPTAILKKLFQAFEKFPKLIFIVKLDKRQCVNMEIPSNVLSLPWLPLNDLLGHPRTRLVITHSSIACHYEAAYHAVPIISFPLPTDGKNLNHFLQKYQVGFSMDIFLFRVEDLQENIHVVLTNSSIRKNANKVSSLLRMKTYNPTETVAFWVEYVIKFGGDHLRSHAMDMSFMQFAMIDIFSSFLFVFLGVFWFAFCYVKFIWHILWKPKNKKYCPT